MRIQNNNQPSFGAIRLYAPVSGKQIVNPLLSMIGSGGVMTLSKPLSICNLPWDKINEIATKYNCTKIQEGLDYFNRTVFNFFFNNPQDEKRALKEMGRIKEEGILEILPNHLLRLKYFNEISRISDKTAWEDVLRLRGELPTISSKKSVLA
jgi:hypothetical protein